MGSKKIPHVLAIDHGTSGCKVALVSIFGKVADFQNEPTPIHFLPGGGAEQDPRDWWNAFTRAARKLMARGSVSPALIRAICVSSTFSSTVAVDRKGDELMNSLTWMDSRGAPHVQKFMRGIINIDGYGLSRILNWIRKTGGGPGLSGKDDIAHVLYLKNERPDIYEKTYRFLSSKDYFNLKLTGEFLASYDAMTLFWVTNAKNINNMNYDDSLISKLGIDREKLPRMIHSIDTVGTLLPSVAKKLGLGKDVKVYSGSPDHQSALVGSGAVKDFQGHLYIGTSSWVECIVPFKKTDILHSIASLPSSIPGRYQCVNEQDMEGGCLTYLIEHVLDAKTLKRKKNENLYAALDRIVAETAPGAGRLIFTPWLHGERSPVDSNTLRGGIHNLAVTSSREEIVRSVFEGIAFNTRWNMDYVEKFTGRPFDGLHFIGGGARSGIWSRVFADILNRPIHQVEDPLQANARGAAFIASVGMGQISFDDIPQLVKTTGEYLPDNRNRALYDDLYHAFLEIYKRNRTLYDRLNSSDNKG